MTSLAPVLLSHFQLMIITGVMDQTTEQIMKKNNTKTCNHHTNGSFKAFVEGFRAVTGREPEEFIDYRFCCCTLDEYNSETLTEEQLGKCRALGKPYGRDALEEALNWKTLKLRPSEVEHLVRWHLEARLDRWLELHDNEVYGGGIPSLTSHRVGRSNARLDYFYFTGGVGDRMDDIERELWRNKIGKLVTKCGCERCLDTRGWLFPETAQEWKRKREIPQWQAFTDEVRRQFPCISDDDLSCLTQRTIEAGESAEPATEAARRAVQLHARWQSEYEAYRVFDHSEEDAIRKAKPEIDALLAKWRGEMVSPATNQTVESGDELF